jgi:ribose-phosphate pyrophosphokinase
VPDTINSAVLIVDDICDGGGTFIGIAKALPKDVKKYLYVTHGIFSKGLRELTGHFEHIYTTNSYPHGYAGNQVTTYDALELML